MKVDCYHFHARLFQHGHLRLQLCFNNKSPVSAFEHERANNTSGAMGMHTPSSPQPAFWSVRRLKGVVRLEHTTIDNTEAPISITGPILEVTME